MKRDGKIYKFRDFKFAVQDGELNMIHPDYYEGQALEGSKPTLDEIFSVIADYFDLQHRDAPLSEFEIALINRNFSWDEKQKLFGDIHTGDNDREGEFELDSEDAWKKAFSSDWNKAYPAIGNKDMASLNEDVPEESRNLTQPSKRSAKYRNRKGPAKYFAPYRNLKHITLEDIEPQDVDVPVAPLRDQLNEKVWTSDNKLKPEVKQALIDIANSFYESLDFGLKVKDVLFTGSLANYGWTQGSDIDLHIIVDYGDLGNIEFLEDYFYLKKKNWLEKHNISIYGFEVEPFVKDEEGEYEYKAIYSIINNEWIVPPRKDKPTIDFKTVQEKSSSLMNKIDKIADIKDEEKRFKQAEALKNKIGGLRQIGLDKEGEYSNENLIYKTLRRAGYTDKLSDAKYSAFDQQMSLNNESEKLIGGPQASDEHLNESKEVIVNKGIVPMLHRLDVQKGIDGMTPDKVGVIKDFISFVCGKLKMEGPVHVCLRRGRDEYIETTASYVPSENTNHVRCGGRALVDIMRSIAHELTHNRQRELNMFKPGETVQNIGGHIEDQANSVAGVFIKDFTHNYGFDNIYDF